MIGFVPLIPITLTKNERVLAASGLLDTGAAVNVMPYTLGVSLGLVWENETPGPALGGNLSATETRMVIVSCTVGAFAPVPLVFT